MKMGIFNSIANWVSGLGKIAGGVAFIVKGSFEIGGALIVSGIGTITGQVSKK